MKSFLSLIAISSVLISSCRHTEGAEGGSDVLEATSKGFRYDSMAIDLVDKDGQPVAGIPVHFVSRHWVYEVAHLPSDVPIFIPVVDPKWVPKEDHRGILGYTDAGGHFETTDFSVKSHGLLPGTGPANFSFEAKGWFPAKCDGGESGIVLDANIGGLNVLEVRPSGSVKPGFGCSLEIDAKKDQNKVLYLRCQSTLTAGDIAQNVETARKNCFP